MDKPESFELSKIEIQALTGWPDTLVEDYRQIGEGINQLFEYIQALEEDISLLQSERVRWLNEWMAGTYLKNDQVRAGLWTMIANKTTADNAAPQEIGVSDFVQPDLPAWAINSSNEAVIMEIRLTTPPSLFKISRYRFHVQDLAATVTYRVFARNNVNGDVRLISATSGSDYSSTGWKETTGEPLVTDEDSDVSLLLKVQNITSTTIGSMPYIYIDRDRDPDDTDPGTGNFTYNRNDYVIRLSVFDSSGADHSASGDGELDNLVIGSTVKVTDDAKPTQSLEFEVQGPPTKYATYYTWPTILISEGADGRPDKDSQATVGYVAPISGSVDYTTNTNYLSTSPNLSGSLEIGANSPVVSNDVGGIDFEFIEFEISPDWDFVSYSG